MTPQGIGVNNRPHRKAYTGPKETKGPQKATGQPTHNAATKVLDARANITAMQGPTRRTCSVLRSHSAHPKQCKRAEANSPGSTVGQRACAAWSNDPSSDSVASGRTTVMVRTDPGDYKASRPCLIKQVGVVNL